MKKIFFLFVLGFFCEACFLHKGYMVNNVCRPKKTNFDIQYQTSNNTNELNFYKVYGLYNFWGEQTKSLSEGFGFYPDGRLIQEYTEDGSSLRKKDICKKNYYNADHIGRWKVDGNIIKLEFFVCGQMGTYIKKEGEIKGDTLVFYENFYSLFLKKEVREEKYVLTDMGFK